MKRRTMFGSMAAFACAMLALLTFAPAAHAQNTESVTVGTLTCTEYYNNPSYGYPLNGNFVDCLSGNPGDGQTKASDEEAVYAAITSTAMERATNAPYFNDSSTSNTNTLNNNGVTFYLFDDVAQIQNSGLPNLPSSSQVGLQGWSYYYTTGSYSALFAKYTVSGSVVIQTSTPMTGVTRHEIGHQLAYELGVNGTQLSAFVSLVQTDFQNIDNDPHFQPGCQTTPTHSGYFYPNFDAAGLAICDNGGWENGYYTDYLYFDNSFNGISYNLNAGVLIAAYPYELSSNNELMAELFALAQGGNGGGPNFDAMAEKDTFDCTAQLINSEFTTHTAPASYTSPYEYICSTD